MSPWARSTYHFWTTVPPRSASKVDIWQTLGRRPSIYEDGGNNTNGPSQSQHQAREVFGWILKWTRVISTGYPVSCIIPASMFQIWRTLDPFKHPYQIGEKVHIIQILLSRIVNGTYRTAVWSPIYAPVFPLSEKQCQNHIGGQCVPRNNKDIHV